MLVYPAGNFRAFFNPIASARPLVLAGHRPAITIIAGSAFTLGPEALHAGPRLDQCAVRSLSQFLVRTVTSQIGASIDMPTNPRKKQVAIHLLHELAFRADRVESLQEQCATTSHRNQRTSPRRARGVAHAIAHSLAARPTLCDLISSQAAMLERNVSTEVVLQHKRAENMSVGTLSDIRRSHLPELAAPDI